MLSSRTFFNRNNWFHSLLGFELWFYQKMKIMASGPITSWEIDGETVDTVVFHDSMWAVGTSPSDPVGDSLTSAELKDWLYVVL